MNQKDRAASPMDGAFTMHPDYTPFTMVANQTSLTGGLKTLPSRGANVPGSTIVTASGTAGTAIAKAAMVTTSAAAVSSTTVPATMRSIAAQWAKWLTQQRTTGPNAVPDYANPEQMNRYVWYQASGWTEPYPGTSKIYSPNDVPGANLPSSDSE